MPLKIAVTGKGGVGKTTVAAILALLYAKEGRKVLAVDADPASSLMSALGVSEELRGRVVPLSGMLDLIEERTGARPGEASGGLFALSPKVSKLLTEGIEGKMNARFWIEPEPRKAAALLYDHIETKRKALGM
jgi:CO dehydrogenase maturation factor